MDLKQKLCHKPHISQRYWHISLNRLGCCGLLNVIVWLWWINLINGTLIERQFIRKTPWDCVVFLSRRTQSGCLLSDAERGNGKAPCGKLNSPFPIECDLKNPWGSVAICLRPTCPQGQRHFILFWYVWNIPFFSSCLILQIGAEFFPPRSE